MSEKKQDTIEFSQVGLVLIAVLLVACLVSSIALGVAVHKVRLQAEALVADFEKCRCQPAPTPAACCKADECCDCDLSKLATKAELVVVRNGLQERIENARRVPVAFPAPVIVGGDVIRIAAIEDGEMVFQDINLNRVCKCEPSNPCACSDKSACECKPVTQPAGPSVNPAPKLQPATACGRRGRR